MLRQGDCVYVGKASAALRSKVEKQMERSGAVAVSATEDAEYTEEDRWLCWTGDATLWYFNEPLPAYRRRTINQVLQGGT